MTQEAIQLPTTPPLSGPDLVGITNKALLTIASGFSGDIDPAGLPGVGPYFIWNDTGNGLRKQRNDSGSEWIVIGRLLEDVAAIGGDAAQTFKAAPSAAADDVVVQSQVFGVGQTRQNVTASRASDVTYTNTGTKPIKVMIQGVSTALGQYFRLRDGALVITYGVVWASTTGPIVLPEITIFPGETYRLDATVPAGWTWREIR